MTSSSNKLSDTNAVAYPTKPLVSKAMPAVVGLTILGLMIPAATFSRQLLGEMGSAVMAVVLFSGALGILARAALSRTLPRRWFVPLVAATPVTVIYSLSTLLQPEFGAVSTLAQLVLVLGFMSGLSLIAWDKTTLKPLFWIFSTLLLAHALWWLTSGMPSLFRGLMSNPNGLGLFAFLLTFVPALMFFYARRGSVLKAVALAAIVCGIILLYATTTRAIWLAAAVAMSVFVLWRPLIVRNRLLFHLTFLVTLGTAFLATWLYIVAPNYAWGWQLNELVFSYTGKDLFSGRHRFWDDLVAAIAERPWFGYGAGTVAETFTDYIWSANSLYLQTALQVGVLGLGALVLLLWVIWGQLWQGRHAIAVRLAAAYFLGLLVHQTFEVSLTQANLAHGFLFWLILAVGLSRAYRTAA